MLAGLGHAPCNMRKAIAASDPDVDDGRYNQVEAEFKQILSYFHNIFGVYQQSLKLFNKDNFAKRRNYLVGNETNEYKTRH